MKINELSQGSEMAADTINNKPIRQPLFKIGDKVHCMVTARYAIYGKTMMVKGRIIGVEYSIYNANEKQYKYKIEYRLKKPSGLKTYTCVQWENYIKGD